MFEKTARGEQLRVEKSAAGGSTHEIVREQRELHVEERAFAHTADDGGHALAGMQVAARLRAIGFVEDHNRMAHGRRQGRELGVYFKVFQSFTDFIQRCDFFQPHAHAFDVAVEDRHAIAVCAEADAGIHKTRAVPFAKELLRL